MSFAFGRGGSGFGSSNNNNQQSQSTGFGGFGSNTGTGFGQQQSSGFGTGTNTTSSGLFGSGGSGFGNSSTSGFGSKPAFGASNNNSTTSGGGLFGGTSSTTGNSGFGSGGFGNTSNTSSNPSPFGSGNTSSGGGLFGNASKPAFGGGSSTGGSLFGGGNTGSGFGQTSNQSSGLFGGAQGTALGLNTPECQGTGSTPFQAFTEKEGPGNSQTNQFQTISSMPPYQKFSFEELRLADYNQGRRYGNGSGQAGAFGTSTGFGGFGSQNTQAAGTGFGASTGNGLFGSQPATSASPFGSTTQTTNAFGSGAGGGLFSAQKPASSLFGNTTTSQTSGGLFGTAGGTGFGNQQSTGFGNTVNSGSSFSNSSQQKPGFSFNTGNTTGTSGTGFGTGGGGSGLFGGSTQNNSPFGGQQQAPTTNPFAASSQTQSGFGGFGNNTQKTGLFGNNSTTTGSNTFASAGQNSGQQPSTGTGIFGNTGTQGAGGSLFGSKPAATGTGSSLFGSGNTNNTNNTGTGLFGSGFANSNNQNQQNQGSSLFGNANAQKPGGLFGTSGTGGTGLFGNNTNQQSGGGSLFGSQGNNQNQQQQPGGGFGNSLNNNSSSLFGNTQPNALQPPQVMTTSLFDNNPYGSSSIFQGLPPPPQASPGPIATPISAGQRAKKLTPLPQYKLNPTMASRFMTPQKRGYGFSYSTYGTPSSISSNVSTPGGLSSSLLTGSIGRGFGKSLSTSNLRRTFENDSDTILSPGAFSADSTRNSGHGSLKKLTIDRSLRTDLFGSQAVAALPSPDKADQSRQPGILKKKVSFDTGTFGENGIRISDDNTESGRTGISINSPTPTAQEQGFLRSSARSSNRPNGTRTNGVAAQSEMEQVKGKELAIVHEDGPAENSHSQARPRVSQVDPEPGNYYMKPSREELRNVPRDRLKRFSGFIVGREACGFVHFDQPVDLTTVDLDHIYDNIAMITTRSLTVYPNLASKPPLGQGLNVPSTISLENSWPRGRDRKTPSYEKSGPKFNKHVDRLRKVEGTEFVKYDQDTGTWVFKVPHFTTYALDYDDESEGDTFQTNVLSEAPDTPTPKSRTPKGRYTPMPTHLAQESSMLSEESSPASSRLDDTFDFKKKRLFPGAFDDAPVFEDDHEMYEIQQNGESFLDERSVTSSSEIGHSQPNEPNEDTSQYDRPQESQGDEMEIVGSFPEADTVNEDLFARESVFKPKSILKASQQTDHLGFGTPGQVKLEIGNSWTLELQRTISPKKQDREVLRETQARIDRHYETEPRDASDRIASTKGGMGFATSIDLMASLFGQNESRKSERGVKQKSKGKGFEWPYLKKSNFHHNESQMTEADRAFHESYKPTWGPGGTLLHAVPSSSSINRKSSAQINSMSMSTQSSLISKGRDIRLSNFSIAPKMTPDSLSIQRTHSKFVIEHAIPYAIPQPIPFRALLEGIPKKAEHEAFVWELASILFNDYEDDISASVPAGQRAHFEHRIRKDRLSIFWEKLCEKKGYGAVTAAPTAEERAIAHLSMHKIVEACDVLVEGKDFRLATLVAQIGDGHIMRQDMATQIDEWRRLNVLSEMTEPIRALYELLAGNTCLCEGKKGPLEDRIRTFIISERFGLDWKRAFGLRLWYAISSEEPIEAAVRKFSADLERDESKRPIPWFVEDEVNSASIKSHASSGEDVLWGLLKLYAEMEENRSITKLTDVVMPGNVTADPLDVRFSFQLYTSLETRFPTNADPLKADQIILNFSSQLESAGEWIWAAFVLLHISVTEGRQKALQSLISHHAPYIRDSDSRPFRTLVDEFKIPESWIWEGKAMYARSVDQAPIKEVEYLLKAHNWREAHRTLCRVMAPQAVIEQDYDVLKNLLDQFAGRDKVPDWDLGGQVYDDYVRLTKGLGSVEKGAVFKRLMSALPAMANDRAEKLGFREMVAVKAMSTVVGASVLGENTHAVEGGRILQLPLTENAYLEHTQDLSFRYYKALMAGGD